MNDFDWNKPRYRVFLELVDCPWVRITQLAEQCRIDRPQCKRYLEEMLEAGIVAVHGRRYGPDNGGYTLIARHSGSNFQATKSNFRDHHGLGERISRPAGRRIDDIARLKMRFWREDLANFDGGRMSIGAGKSLWHPARWLEIQKNDGFPVFHALVYDLSTREDDIKMAVRKMRDASASSADSWRFLVVCGDATAASIWMEQGDDLLMLVATLADVLKGSFRGSDSVWMKDGQTADIIALV